MDAMQQHLALAEHQQMTTERLILRPVTLADAEDMYAYASDATTTQHMPWPRHTSLANTQSNIANFFMAAPLGKFGIQLQGTDTLIGTCDIRIKGNGVAEIGYIIHQDHWGKGYATETAAALIALGFNHLGMDKVMAVHHEDNQSSGKVMTKLGMRLEGVLRQGEALMGKVYSPHVYGILKNEYQG